MHQAIHPIEKDPNHLAPPVPFVKGKGRGKGGGKGGGGLGVGKRTGKGKDNLQYKGDKGNL